MKVLLINPGSEGLKPTKQSNGSFPLGLAYIAAALQKDGHYVKVLDSRLDDIKISRLPGMVTNYDIAGISTSVGSSLKYTLDALEILKGEIPLMVGGPLSSSMPIRFLEETAAEFVIVGEGELTVTELVDSLEKGKPVKKIAGLCYRKDGKPVSNPLRPPIPNLDEIPIPAYDLFRTKEYLFSVEGDLNFGNKCLPIMSSRGCPFSCKFCFHNFGRRWRTRSPNKIVDEIELLSEKYGVDGVQFYDDNFTLSETRVLEICKEITERELEIGWTCEGRCDILSKKPKMIDSMARAGCKIILIGAESGSQRMLNVMRKNITTKEIKTACLNIKNSGIKIKAGFMLGMPTETVHDAEMTIKLINELVGMGAYIFTGFFNPRPSTPWYELAKKKGFNPNLRGWVEYDKFDGISVNLSAMNEHDLHKMRSRMYTLAIQKGRMKRLFYHLRERGMLKTIKMIKREGLKNTASVILSSLKR